MGGFPGDKSQSGGGGGVRSFGGRQTGLKFFLHHGSTGKSFYFPEALFPYRQNGILTSISLGGPED